jgi:hypothetical protein
VADLKIDPTPPRVSVRRLGRDRVRVSVYDRASGAHAGGTVITFGDGSRPARGRLTATHVYATPGLYLITVRCSNNVGVSALHHVWVEAR